MKKIVDYIRRQLSFRVSMWVVLFAAIIFAETREVGLSFWLGISLIIISVFLQSRRTVTSS